MRIALLLPAVAGGLVAAVACGAGGIERLHEDTFDAGNGVILGPDNRPAPTGPAGSGLATGLPCDVQALLENRCIGCHVGKTAGAPRLLDYADLTAPSKTDPRQSMAQISLARMKSTTNRMPPPPAAPANADEIATMAEWVASGTTKRGLCTDPPPARIPPADAGGDAAALCASGVKWTRGDEGDPLMHPGRACNACH